MGFNKIVFIPFINLSSFSSRNCSLLSIISWSALAEIWVVCRIHSKFGFQF